jgi:hypothetical protein
VGVFGGEGYWCCVARVDFLETGVVDYICAYEEMFGV